MKQRARHGQLPPARQHLPGVPHTPRTPHAPRPGQYQFFSLAPGPRDTQAGRHHHRPNFPKSSSPNNFPRFPPPPSPPHQSSIHPTTFLKHFHPSRPRQNSPNRASTTYRITRIPPATTRQFSSRTNLNNRRNINNGRRQGKVRGRKELGRQDGDGRGPQEAAEPLGEGRSPGKRRPCPFLAPSRRDASVRVVFRDPCCFVAPSPPIWDMAISTRRDRVTRGAIRRDGRPSSGRRAPSRRWRVIPGSSVPQPTSPTSPPQQSRLAKHHPTAPPQPTPTRTIS